MAERIRESITPSGVPFAVRNLIGSDQNLLSEMIEDSDHTGFNKMLKGALRKLGAKKETEITIKDIQNLLSNDRKFMLVTLREHTLGYKKKFDFKFEWPMRKGSSDKEAVDYSVNMSSENFPIIPYFWVREYIKEIQTNDKAEGYDPDYNPDGHVILFPKLYDDYADMLKERLIVETSFSDGDRYRWRLLDGNQELKFAKAKVVINTILDMRAPQVPFVNKDGNEIWTAFDTSKTDIMFIEQLRAEIKDKEGFVDTFLTIQNPDNVRSQRVDLVNLPVFFFPSQAL